MMKYSKWAACCSIVAIAELLALSTSMLLWFFRPLRSETGAEFISKYLSDCRFFT
jgi:hypothetical protein